MYPAAASCCQTTICPMRNASVRAPASRNAVLRRAASPRPPAERAPSKVRLHTIRTAELNQSNPGLGMATQSVDSSMRMWYAAKKRKNTTATMAMKTTSATFRFGTGNPPVRSWATPVSSGSQGFSVNLAKSPTKSSLRSMPHT